MLSMLIAGCAHKASNQKLFNNIHYFYGEKNIRIRENEVSVFIGAGSSNPKSNMLRGVDGGVSAVVESGGHECVNLSYNVVLGDGFNFSMGGKMLGIYGGSPKSNKNKNKYSSGFSARLNWGENGLIGLYIYSDENNGDYGKFYPSRSYFSSGANNFKILACVDKINKSVDVDLCFNEQSAVKVNGIKYNKGGDVDGIFLDVFFGGEGDIFASKKNQTINIKNIEYKGANKNEFTFKC